MTGTFGANGKGMPSIGRIPGYPNCYAVVGYGGNGITFSWIAANLLVDRFLERPNRDAELFGFER